MTTPPVIRQSSVVVASQPTPSERLAALADDLDHSLAGAATVVRTEEVPGHVATIEVRPKRSDAAGFAWTTLGSSEVILSVDDGGRWELGWTNEDVDLLQDIVKSVLAGRVSGVRAPGRSGMTVMLEDGRKLRTSVGYAPAGCLPLPLWRRWGRQVNFRGYRT